MRCLRGKVSTVRQEVRRRWMLKTMPLMNNRTALKMYKDV